MFISVQHELNAIQQQFKDLSTYTKDRAIPFAINQVGSKAFTHSIRAMSSITGIPQKNLRHGNDGINPRPIMKKTQANKYRSFFEINTKSRWLHITETYFNAKQAKSGVSSKYYSIRKTHTGSFFGKGQNSGKLIAFIRTNKVRTVQGLKKQLKRAIVKPVWAFNPANEFMKARIADDILKTYTPLIIERYNQKLFQYLNNKKSSPKK